jgi:hypothetical protein
MAGRHLERSRRVLEHLRRRHFAPLSDRAGLDRIDTAEKFVEGG